MTKNIKGITIELDGDATGLTQALKKVDTETKGVQNELRQVDRLLKFDPSNVELLSQKQKLLGDAVDNTSKRLDALKQAQSQVEQQFQNGEIGEEAYRKFQREIIATEGRLKAFQKQAEATKVKIDAQTDTSGLDKMKQKLEEVSKTAKETGEKMKNIGSEMTAKVSAPIAAFGTGALLSAAQFDNAAGQIQAALGVTADEAAALEDIATNVWKQGFGESLEDVSDALIRVKQNFQNLDDGELENVTRNSLALAKSFDSDVNEVTRAANNLMTNFGVSSDEAFDMMAKGAQNGLNFSNELFDNLSEYAPLWADMGYSAEEMFGILEAGAKEGVYNLDYLNDVMKEFQIRATDGSKSTTEAVAELGPEVKKVWEAFSEGESSVSEMAQVATAELSKINDKVKQNELGVALFGTKWEDLGGDVVLSMLQAGQSLEDFEGAMLSVSEAQEQTFGQRWESFTRTAAASLEPLGVILLELAEQWLPKIIAVVEVLATWFANLSPFVQNLTLIFGGLAAAIGPVLVIFGSIVSSLGTLIPLFTSGGVVASAFGTVMTALTGPIGIAIAAIIGIVTALVTAYNNIEWFRDGVNEIWNTIKEYTSTVFGAIKELIGTLISSAVDFAKDILDKFKDFWDENGQAILSIVELYFGYVKNNIEMVMGLIKGIFEIVWPIISGIVKVAWENIQLVVGTALDIVMGLISTVMNLIQGDWEGAWESIKGIAEDIWENIETFFKDIDLYQIGKDILQGLIDGIKSMADAVLKAVTGVVTDAINAAKSLLGINSPSKVFMEFGEWTNEGFIEGINSSSKRLLDAVNNVYGSLASSAKKSVESSSNVYTTTSTVDNSRRFNPTVNIYTTDSGDKAMQRTLRRLAFQFN